MIAVIINPIAGGALRSVAAARAEIAGAWLSAHGLAGQVFVTERRGHARELAAAARARGDDPVIAWGGDGTVNEVASALAFGPTALGIVPAGSGNGLARELGIDRRPDRALATAAAAARSGGRVIDAGELGGRLFFNVAGVGFDAHVAACFDRDLSGHRGLLGYARIVCRELARYRPSGYRVSTGQSTFAGPALLVTLANSPQFGNGARIAPGARVDDGRLDLVIFQEASRARTLLALPRLFAGGLGRLSGVSIEPVERVVIEGEAPLTAHVDGEPFSAGPTLHARVHPAALRIAVEVPVRRGA